MARPCNTTTRIAQQIQSALARSSPYKLRWPGCSPKVVHDKRARWACCMRDPGWCANEQLTQQARHLQGQRQAARGVEVQPGQGLLRQRLPDQRRPEGGAAARIVLQGRGRGAGSKSPAERSVAGQGQSCSETKVVPTRVPSPAAQVGAQGSWARAGALAWARAVMRRMYEAAAAALCRRVMLTIGAMAGTPRPASEICMNA